MAKSQGSSDNNENIPPQTENPVDETVDSREKTGFLQNPAVLKIGMYVITAVVIVLAVWGIGSLITHATALTPEPTATTTPTEVAMPADLTTPTFSTENEPDGLVRLPEVVFTAEIVPTPEVRDEIITYTVEAGDTIFGIGEKFGLKPETVLWSNRYTLGDTPDGLSIGFELLILPFDGLIHIWSEGEGLNGVSSFYDVSPDVIVDYPGNNLDRNIVGDFSNPNIPPGKMLVVPGGTRPSVSWVIARDNPASGNAYLGPGACSGIIYGDVGTGTFTWPTTATYLSGYDYAPPVHNGLDFDGDFGSPIYAADSGVIVYSGWSDRGYGNLIVVDHESGWQTYYAHLMDGTLLSCGVSVQKGETIAAMGSTGNSTGPHLHFEMRLNGAAVNPWLYLQ